MTNNSFPARTNFVIAILLLAVITLASISAIEYGQVQSLNSRPISVSTTTVTATESSISSLAKGAFVIFHQFECGGYMNKPWAVTVGNETKTQPPGSLKDLKTFNPGETEVQGYDANASIITFFLANGVYNYTAFPFSGMGGIMKTPLGTIITLNSTSGTFRVHGADLALHFVGGCPP